MRPEFHIFLLIVLVLKLVLVPVIVLVLLVLLAIFVLGSFVSSTNPSGSETLPAEFSSLATPLTLILIPLGCFESDMRDSGQSNVRGA